MAQYLYHLSLTTGHARKSYRSEISDEALQVCADLIRQIRARPGLIVDMPPLFPERYFMSGIVSGHCMTVQVFRDLEFDQAGFRELPLPEKLGCVEEAGRARGSPRQNQHIDPCPVFIEPTRDLAERVSKRRIAPMFRDTYVGRVIQEQPLVTLGIAGRERCGAAIWQQLAAQGDQPAAPWLAVKIELGIVGDPAMHWLGDFERCLGWAFLEAESE